MGELYCFFLVGLGDCPLPGTEELMERWVFASPEESKAPAGALGGTGLPFICPFERERHEGGSV